MFVVKVEAMKVVWAGRGQTLPALQLYPLTELQICEQFGNCEKEKSLEVRGKPGGRSSPRTAQAAGAVSPAAVLRLHRGEQSLLSLPGL